MTDYTSQLIGTHTLPQKRLRALYASIQRMNSVCLTEALTSFQIAPRIKVVERFQPHLPPVMATHEKLVQSFCHIIGNSLDALDKRGKGHLWLSTRRRPDGLVEAVISDDGPGIQPNIL